VRWKRLAWTCLGVVAFGACGDDTSGGGTDTIPVVDTVNPIDTTPPPDTWTPLDVTPGDTVGAEDTAAADTVVADTVAGDTVVSDTSGADTSVADSTSTDTSATDTVAADTAVTDTHTTDTLDPSCLTATVTAALHQSQANAPTYYVQGNFGFGDPGVVDVISIEFYQAVPATGAFPLGINPNDDYATCRECVVVYADYDAGTQSAAAYFFQTGGTLIVDSATPPGSAEMKVTLSGVGVEEVTFDEQTATSTPVPGGLCYNLNVPSPLEVAPSAGCSPVTLSGTLVQGPATVYTAPTDLGIGDPALDDLVWVEFYGTTATGTFDLGSAANSNYATCSECVMVIADYESDTPTYHFQTGGALVVDAATTPGGEAMTLTLSGLSFEEVTIDESYVSTPVPDGACLDAPGPTTLSTGPLIPPECGAMTLPSELERNATYDKVYNAVAHLGLGDSSVPDLLSLEFFTEETGTFDLASAANANYQSCEQCVLVYADYDGGSYSGVYYQAGGSLSIHAGTPPGGESLYVTVSGLSLAEVEIDPTTYASTPVEDGDCYGLPGSKTLVAAPATCVPFCGDHVCGSDGCGGVCGDDCDNGGTCTLDGTYCEAIPSCAQVTVGGPVLEPQGFTMFAADLTGEQLGAPIMFDRLRVSFQDDETTGTVDLASPFNSNWATCTQCVLADVDWNGEGVRHFFQSAGVMTIEAGSNLSDGPLSLGIVGLRLVEVTYDPNDGHSIPVPNGACIDVTVSPDLSTP